MMRYDEIHFPMDESNLSKEIREFIQTFIPSLGALEVLLLLFNNPDHAWTPDSIAMKLRSNMLMVNDFLAFFKSKGVVTEHGGSYSFNQDQHDFNLRLKELSGAFYERPVSVLNEIYRIPNKPGSKIQVFADAFKIKKEK